MMLGKKLIISIKPFIKPVAFTCVGIIVVLMLICSVLFMQGKSVDDLLSPTIVKEELGIELVNAMYNFDSPYQLDAQMKIIKSLVTEDVFNDITIDNEERTMLTYMKFKDCGVHVRIIDSSENFVRYTLITDALSAEREFVLFFYVDDKGMIYDIEEAECVKFLDTIY